MGNHVDWTSVPKGTIVEVWDGPGSIRRLGQFVKYNESHPYQFVAACPSDCRDKSAWAHCRIYKEKSNAIQSE